MQFCSKLFAFLWLGLSACAGGMAEGTAQADGEGGGASANSTGDSAGNSGANSGGSGTSATSSGSAAQGGATNSPSPCGASPWVTLDGAVNVRSLGGVALTNGDWVACNQLYRGGYLYGLTEQGCLDFSALGIKTVVDLRSLAEQTSAPSAICVSEQATIVSAPMPVPYNVSAADYVTDLYAAEAIVAAMEVLADEAAYPVYFHCLHGRDRSGVMAAVVLRALGATRQTVLNEYLLSGATGSLVYPESLLAVLDEIDTLGGIDAYFATMGVAPSLVMAMRQLLVVDTGG